MHINCHAHIFNLPAVATQHSVQTLINRILAMLPEAVEKGFAERLLKDLLEARTTDAGVMDKLAGWLRDFQASGTLTDFIHRADPSRRERLARANARLAALADRENLLETGIALDELIAESDDTDADRKSLADFIDFLRIGFLPTIQDVADELMTQTPADAGIVALTMDITRGDMFEEQFIAQLEETASAATRYPGRIFPFVAVNPTRANHYAIMERALTELQFKGVKLYPSLGYDIDSPAMRRVYAYCQANGVPLLMHCNQGGFYYTPQYISNSSPEHWHAILNDFPELKICFGHFGGGGDLAGPQLPGEGTWAGMILNLMEKWPGVFADTSYHDEPMAGGHAETNYFANLERLLQRETVRERILFGTDFFMIRIRLKDKNYWSYFEDHLGRDFETIAGENPHRFLFPA